MTSGKLMKQSAEVAKWLSGLKNVKWAKPSTVEFNNKTYPAAIYHDHAGVRVYVLGVKPKKLKSRVNYCFVDRFGKTWYVTGYITKIEDRYKQFHPFGPNFMIGVWPTNEYGEIDQHERFTYPRIDVKIQGNDKNFS